MRYRAFRLQKLLGRIRPFCVYMLYTHFESQPSKLKFHVLVSCDPIITFLINSGPPRFGNLDAYVELYPDFNEYLNHVSYIDCNQPYINSITIQRLLETQSKGEICKIGKTQLKEAINYATTIKPKHLKAISSYLV